MKVEDLAVGDTITKDAGTFKLPPLKFPTPMIGLAVEPKSRADQQKISGALHKIAEEDQTFTLTRESQTKEMVIHGMSELHLHMMQERVHKRDKVEMVSHAAENSVSRNGRRARRGLLPAQEAVGRLRAVCRSSLPDLARAARHQAGRVLHQGSLCEHAGVPLRPRAQLRALSIA